jgi:acetyltransferase-like isoleucine patch superfamily enzyme
MKFISGIFRLLLRKTQTLSFFLRILKLKLLYPGIEIDFKSKIHNHCSIVCIKGGKLIITNSHILFGTHIVADTNSTLSIQDSFIGRNCVITAKERVTIKKGCLMAEMVVIRDQDHVVDIMTGKNQREEFYTAPVEIGENVWIASKATILKGVTIGKYSVIAASAVVTKEVPAYEVWGGVPAKFIKQVNHKANKKKFSNSL